MLTFKQANVQLATACHDVRCSLREEPYAAEHLNVNRSSEQYATEALLPCGPRYTSLYSALVLSSWVRKRGDSPWLIAVPRATSSGLHNH